MNYNMTWVSSAMRCHDSVTTMKAIEEGKIGWFALGMEDTGWRPSLSFDMTWVGGHYVPQLSQGSVTYAIEKDYLGWFTFSIWYLTGDKLP